MKELYWLDRIQPSDRLSVGEKAFVLSQFRQQGYPIPTGFVISTEFWREFIENLEGKASILTDLPYSSLHLDVDDRSTLQRVARQSRQEILGATLPAEWRSLFTTAAQQLKSCALILRISLSLPHSLEERFSGLLPSQVCWCEPEALELAIKRTWAELFSAKSLFYWQRRGIGIEQIDLAILVQPLENAIASGTTAIDSDCLEIQSTWGLGYSILRGEVLPDTYQIQLSTGQIKTQQLGYKIRAYRLKSMPESTDRDIPLETYVLAPEEQERYSLDETILEQLIRLARRLVAEQQFSGSFEWTLSSVSQLSIAQIRPNLSKQAPAASLIPTRSVMENSQLLLTGLSASPGKAIAVAHTIADDAHLAAVPVGSILVARQINPHWLPWIKQAAGIIAERGGITSHTAIIARELGIPAIVNATGAMQRVRTGELLLLDGDKGEVYRLKEESPTVTETCPETPIQKSEVQELIADYPIGTQLMVNLSQPSAIAKAAALPVDGVGLLRSEWMISELLSQKPLEEWLEPSQQSHLVEWLTQAIAEFARGFAPRPVFYRSIDSKAPEFSFLLGKKSSEQRGTCGYQLNPTLFELELQALKQVSDSGYTNVNLILPFVRGVEEFSFCRSRVERAGLLDRQMFQLWIMAEVPSVIFLLPQLIRAGVGGISIGTNDLTQFLLAVDREGAMSSDRLNARHPAMLAAIEQLIRLARDAEIPCSICGQAPVQYPELVDRLIQWGITSISVEPEAVERTCRAIARAERRLLLKASRKMLSGDRSDLPV
ncbi:peptide chain release factor H [Hydrococcus rivularis NIES-593]|uniref:Phosphoenolpyruvate synthase n=1 Tax=Hydrococcus rivularis NIES-593 TaxID=1921803 RepID=A0A1U7HEV1_9CYAN|nr:putative PEP-binding protein [Hydrococcus rivularis]OKH22075.1 peptide chain release factor H [Hydrococcus rivularis NIES-593]